MIRKALKHVSAVLLGLLILNAFCAWYYNPAPYIQAAHRATDVVRKPGARTSQAKEGIGMHRIDENGYNNPSGRSGEGISVLMMGSSHLEGFNVPAGANTAARLEALLNAAGRPGRVYNLGMSSHTLPRNAQNMAAALEQFRPTDCVVLETMSVMLNSGSVYAAMSGSMERIRATGAGLPGIGNVPLFKRLYKQFMELTAGSGEPQGAGEDSISEDTLSWYRETLTEWFSGLAEAAADDGVRLIICYHPHLVPQADGTVVPDEPEVCRAAFQSACDSAGVTFVDLTERFTEAYEARRVLPHGFANTAMGIGHLNAEGHAMMAEALFRAIMNAEGDAA